MKSGITAAQAETGSVTLELSGLLDRKLEVSQKQRILSGFQERFILTEDEINCLTSTAEPIDDLFFVSLSKAKRISKDCDFLLGLENQTLGLDLTEQISKYVNYGFQKLYKWVQRSFKTLNLENPQMSSSIRRALRVLAERPSLFQNCLDFFAEARERILSESFHVALTGRDHSGAHDTSVKPIDLTAHDALRYVGDMLAWVHSAVVSECEALEVLFVADGEELATGLKTGKKAEIWRMVDEDEGQDDFNALKTLNQLVDRNTSGVARLLRQRIEQVAQATDETISAYRLASLITFYRVTFDKLLGSASNLAECIKGLEADALFQFRSLVKDNIAGIHGDIHEAPDDLRPPQFFQVSLEQLSAIMRVYDASLSAPEAREDEFESVMIEAFDPFLAGCCNIAQTLDEPDNAVFLINCHLAATNNLEGHEFVSKRLNQLRDIIQEQSVKLTASQHQFLRRQSGLGQILAVDDQSKFGDIISRDYLTRASQRLDEFLPSALMDANDRVKNLLSSSLARQVTEEAAERFCNDFEILERVIDDLDESQGGKDESGEPELRSVFPRTCAEIRVLLS